MSRKFVSKLVKLSSEFDVDATVYLALDQRNTRQAQKITTLKKYVDKHPSGWKKRLELAELLYETGQWAEAIVEYKQVINRQPQLIQAYIQLGKILQFMFREKEAIATYRTAITFTSYDATKHYLQGLVADCLHDRLGAISAFQKAANSDPNSLISWLALGKMQMLIESPIDALSSFEHMLSIDPNDFMALIYSHDLLLHLGNYSEAETRLKKATKIAPNDIQTLKRNLAYRYRQRLVNESAGKQTKQLLNTLMTQANGLPEAHSLLARYYILRKQPQKGRQMLQRCTEEQAHNPQAWYYYGLCLQSLGEMTAAAEALLKAYTLSGTRCDREIYRALCNVLPSLGKQEQTRELMTEMLRKFPESWSLWALVGKILVEHFQEIELGCRYAQHGVSLQPKLADACFAQGRVLALAEKSSSAIAAFNQGWALRYPGSQSLNAISAATWMGESQQKLGQQKAAQRWLHWASEQAERLLAYHPEKAKYWYERAQRALALDSND
ncbi:MAG: tetratricopeptide repeat protein [Phormidesmis sp.]